MSFESGTSEELDRELAETLQEYRAGINAWAEAAMVRPRAVEVRPAHRPIWRLAAGWGLSCVLVVGGLSAGAYTHVHRQQMAKIAAARVVEQQKVVAEARAQQEEEDLLAQVDSDVSREVPSAMEPLAQLMSGDSIR
jgi:uncharacterized protein HemX